MIKYVVLAIFLVLKFFTLDNCFFWDNVAGYSIPASYLLEHGFLQFIYPPELVSKSPNHGTAFSATCHSTRCDKK